MAMYNDLMVRDSLSDTGQVPYQNYNEWCPDIIPKVQPLPPGTALQTLIDTYSSDIGENLEKGQINYIYLRAKNLASTLQSGSINLYYTDESTFIFPRQWKDNKIGTINVSSQPNAVAANAEPLMWTPPPERQDGYCLIAQVVTDNHPNPIPDFDTSDEWWAWVHGNAAIANRNVKLVDNIPDTGTQWKLQLLNPDPVAHTHAIEAECHNCPIGSTVSIFCPSTLPSPQIDVTQTIRNSTLANVVAMSDLPANFLDDFVVSFQPPGDKKPIGATIIIKQYTSPLQADVNMMKDAVHAEKLLKGNVPVGMNNDLPLVYLGCFTYDIV